MRTYYIYTEVADLYYNVLTHCNPEIQPPLMRDRGTRGPHTICNTCADADAYSVVKFMHKPMRYEIPEMLPAYLHK